MTNIVGGPVYVQNHMYLYFTLIYGRISNFCYFKCHGSGSKKRFPLVRFYLMGFQHNLRQRISFGETEMRRKTRQVPLFYYCYILYPLSSGWPLLNLAFQPFISIHVLYVLVLWSQSLSSQIGGLTREVDRSN